MIAIMLALLSAAADDPECNHIGGALSGASITPEVVRPGDRAAIAYVYRDGPDGVKTIPARCVTRLKVTGPARLESRDMLQVADAARAGDIVTLSMRIGNTPYSRTITVTGRDEQVLTGTWHPVASEHCRSRVPAEIRFGPDGRYSYTFPEAMVETMTSGSGDYRWDAASGALSLDARTGAARFEGGRLVLEGVDFDWPPPVPAGAPQPPPCRILLGG